MKKIATSFLLVLLLIICMGSAPASAYTVKVKAVDPSGNPEEYATCRVFGTDSIHPVAAGVTDTLGIWTGSIAKAGTYRLQLEVIGSAVAAKNFTVSDAAPVADLGTMTSGVNELSEFVVTAQRPIVTKEIDRIGYDVKADATAQTLTVREVLRRVPMVSVDGEGNIKVNGSSNFKVFKNGRPSNSLSKNAKDIFDALPAASIKRIEVITEPGAKYDAEGIGAILNIVTDDETVIKGVTGRVGGSYDFIVNRTNGNLWLSSQIKKVTFSINGGVQNFPSKVQESHSVYDYTYENGTHSYRTDDQYIRGMVEWFGGEASWEIDSLNLISGEFDGYEYHISGNGSGTQSLTAADGNLLSKYTQKYDISNSSYFDINGSINYQHLTHRKGEALTLSYMVSTTNQKRTTVTSFEDVFGTMFDYTGFNGIYHLNFIEHTFQADWTRPTAKNHTLDIGAKYILRRNHSKTNYEYTGWEDQYSDFRHITDVAAAYAQYSVKVSKMTLRAGLRYEFSKLKADYPDGSQDEFFSNLNDWVPSAAASWQINDANSLAVNYATRISRPGISYLNPAKKYTPTSLSEGNPNLESAHAQSVKLTYMLIRPCFNLNLWSQYAFTNNDIVQVTTLEGEILHNSYENIGKIRTFSAGVFTQWSPTNKTSFMLSGNINYNSISQTVFTNNGWGGSAYVRATQKLPLNLEAELWANYSQYNIYDAFNRNRNGFMDNFWYGLNITGKYLKDNALSISLSLTNPIGQHSNFHTTEALRGAYTGTSVTRMDNLRMQVGISIGYRFGNLNASVKKTAARINNDDLKGRKG